MEGNNTPQNSPPLEYIDPENHPNNSDHEDGLPSSGPDDPNGPDNPNDPNGVSDNEPDDDPHCLFLHALHDLLDSLWNLCQPQVAKPEKIKVCEPDTFDGTNPWKLQDFLISCNLHCHDCSDVFTSDEKRILFTLSYLKGSALSWSEPGLNDPTNFTHWMWNYQAFLSKLENNFSPHDPIGDAEKSLSELVMKKTAKIMKYNVDIWELASQVSWNEVALCDHYYCRLLLCLCTDMLHRG